jgi:dTDP-glucose pyrophosphorylase
MNQVIPRFLVKRDLSLTGAMEQLEKTEERILFVVDGDGALYGSVTDGDLRRWILAKGSVEGTVEQVCNKHPFSVRPGFDLDAVRQRMIDKRFSCVPVIDKAGQVIDLLFLNQVLGEGRQRAALRPVNIPVVIMAGGKGTRLDPLTRVLPKPLIPLGDKTVIETIMDTFVRHGVGHFFVSVHTKARLVKSYFEETNLPFRIEFLEESEPLGTAGALRFLVGKVDGTFLVTNCDIIIKADFADLVDHHRREGNDITIVASLKTYAIPYGICQIGPEGRFLGMSEKPEYRFLVNTGMYAIDSSVLGHIPAGRMYHVTDLIEATQAAGGRVGVFPISESSWMDTGEWAEYKRTLLQFSP